MTDFKDFEDVDTSEVDDYVIKMYDFVPMETEHDYLAIKKYVRKILEIIEKGDSNENEEKKS